MSRIGKKPIAIPAGVEVKIDGNVVEVKGKNGTLKQSFRPEINIAVENGEIIVSRPDDTKEMKSLHGLTRTLVSNMVTGVSTGFTKELEINGVGYKAVKEGTNLVMNLGYSHQVIIPEKDGVTYAIQCKAYTTPVGVKAVQEACAGREFYDRMVGAVLTNQYFTKPAVEAAKKLKILLWDRGYLDSMIEEE